MKVSSSMVVFLIAGIHCFPMRLLADWPDRHTLVSGNIFVNDKEYAGTYLRKSGFDIKKITQSELSSTLGKIESCLSIGDYSCVMSLYEPKSIQKKFFAGKHFSKPEQFQKAWMEQVRIGKDLSLPLLVPYRLKNKGKIDYGSIHWRVFVGEFNPDKLDLHPVSFCAELRSGKRVSRSSSSFFIACFERGTPKQKFSMTDPSPFFYEEMDENSWPYNQPGLIRLLGK